MDRDVKAYPWYIPLWKSLIATDVFPLAIVATAA